MEKLQEFAMKHFLFASLCSSFALSICAGSVIITAGFKITSVKCPPFSSVSFMVPLALSL